MNDHHIYIHKGIAEGRSPLSPASPMRQATANTPPSTQKFITLGVGIMLARRTLNAVADDIRAGGQEVLATQIENGVRAAGLALLAVKAPPALVLVGVNQGINAVTTIRAINRENNIRAFEREQLGQRLDHSMRGVAIFD